MKVTKTVASTTAILIGLGGSAVSAASDNVQVFRAGLVSGITDSVEADVRVLRGSPDVRAAGDVSASVRDDTMPQVVAAGSKVWFVDYAARRLTACRLRKTTQIGGYVVACHSRNLPH